MKAIKILSVIILLMTACIFAQNTNPVVSNVSFSILNGTVTVKYDVADTEQSSVNIMMEVSSDAGATWSFIYGTPSGAIGDGIPIGNNKTITWSYEGAQNDNFKIRIIADDAVGDQVYYSGKVYNTVTINSQVWLKENLDVGARINSGTAQSNNGVIEKYCYDNNPMNCNTYGGLYQWAETVQYLNNSTNTTAPSPAFSGHVKGICPAGWHIPTQAEFVAFRNSTAVSNNSNNILAVGQGNGTDVTGFSALLAGYSHESNGTFSDLGTFVFFWTITGGTMNAYYLVAASNPTAINFYDYSKSCGFSVRCMKNY